MDVLSIYLSGKKTPIEYFVIMTKYHIITKRLWCITVHKLGNLSVTQPQLLPRVRRVRASLPVCQVLRRPAGAEPAGSGDPRPAHRRSGDPDPHTCRAEAAGNRSAGPATGGLGGRRRDGNVSGTGGKEGSMFTSRASRPEVMSAGR